MLQAANDVEGPDPRAALESLGDSQVEDDGEATSAQAADEFGGDDADPAPAVDEGEDGSEFPSYWVCPFTHEPPTRPYYFNIASQDGTMSPQVFECVSLYRYIAHMQSNTRWHVLHPMNRQMIRRHLALGRLVQPPEDVEARIGQERHRLGLPAVLLPVTAADKEKMDNMRLRVAEQ